jgi:hypothetical protein
MKPFKLVLFLFVFVSTVWGQEETLAGAESHNGGFGGPVIKMGQVNDQFGLFIGGRGGWIINHSFVIGGGGYGLVNSVTAQANANGDIDEITFGYGGVEFEYIINSDKLTHFTIYSLFGAGGYHYRNKYENYDREDASDINDSETFFIAEPAVNLEINFSKFFRLSVGAGYRFIAGKSNTGFISGSDLSGFSGTLTFKFGRF